MNSGELGNTCCWKEKKVFGWRRVRMGKALQRQTICSHDIPNLSPEVPQHAQTKSAHSEGLSWVWSGREMGFKTNCSFSKPFEGVWQRRMT